MNIFAATSRGYFPYLTVMLASLYQNHPDESVDVYVIHTDLLPEDIMLLEKQLSHKKHKIHSVYVDPSPISALSTSQTMSYAAYLRLFAIDALPETISKILYLDVDIIVRKPLLDLYQTDMEGYTVAACESPSFNSKYYKSQIGMPCDQTYFNSGVMLLNLQEMRRDGITLQFLLDVAKKNNRRGICFDQDILNLAIGSKLLLLPEEQYNCSPDVFDQLYGDRKALTAPFGAIIHYYQQDQKPWKVPVSYDNSEIAGVWWEYAEKSPFYSKLRSEYENGLTERLENQNIALRLYFGAMIKWMKVEDRGRKVEKYLLSRSYRTIALYGANPFQDLLCGDLQNSQVKISYIIDTFAKGRVNGYEIKNGTHFEDVDAIIITAFAHQKDIVSRLDGSRPVLSFSSIINEIGTYTE